MVTELHPFDLASLPYSTEHQVTPGCAGSSASHSRWARSGAAPTTPSPALNASLKRETLQGAASWAVHNARLAVFSWISRYNTQRRLSYCGYLSPSTHQNTTTTTM